jgi:hypothetical protein
VRNVGVGVRGADKAGLFELALESGVTLSEYMRRALAAYYLGRTLTDPLKG